MSFTHFGLEFEKSTENTVSKIAMCVRSLLVAVFTTLSVLVSSSESSIAQTDEKPVYQFKDTRISQADTLLAHKQYEEALKAYQQSLDVYSKESFYEGMVYTTERMAVCHRRLGDDKLSAATFQKAIELAKEKLEPNHMLLSKAYLNNGIRLHRKLRFHKAAEQLDSSMATYRYSHKYDSGLFKKIVSYKYYAYYYSELNPDTTLVYSYLRLALVNKNEIAKDNLILAISDIVRAYYIMGDTQKSISYALEGLRQAKLNSSAVSPYYYSEILFTTGRSFEQSKDYKNALKTVNQLISYTLKNDSKNKELIGYYNLKAIVLVGLQRYTEAQEILSKVIDSAVGDEFSDNFKIDLVMNLGISYTRSGDFVKAEHYLKESLGMQKKLNDQSAHAMSIRFRYLGQLYNKWEYYEKATAYYDSAIWVQLGEGSKGFESFEVANGKSISIGTMKLFRFKILNLYLSYDADQGDKSSLLPSLLEHIKLINEYSSDLNSRLNGSNNSKLFQKGELKQTHQLALEVCSFLYRQNKEIEYLNEVTKQLSQSKSLLFLEQMGEYSIITNHIISQHTQTQFSHAKLAIDSLDNLINQQIAIDPLGDSVMILNNEKMKWNARLAEVRETIEKEYPDATNDLLSKDVTINSLRADHQLTDEKALIEYFVGDSVIFVVGLSGEKESFHRIKKDEKLNQALSNFLGEVNTTPHSGELNEHLKNFGESASTLYQKLLQPVLDDLGEISEMVIVPDDILSRVPFEMLVSEWSGKESSFKELNYLLKKVKVSHLLSSKVSFNELTETQGKGMLGFGYAGEGIVDERAEMGGLPGALKEINFLKSNFQGDYYIGKEGTKRQFLKKAGDYDVIHLALHGKSDSVNRYNSALVFNGDHDYYMTSTDLYRTRLKSKLAVLSACETGIGKISEGEGSFSIARGFAIAGVPAIVTTLWKVNDEAGATITEQFYRNLQAGDKKDQALRQAKLKYLEESDNLTSSPFYWGNYILIGDTSTIELKGKAGLPWQWAVITLLLLASLGLGLRRLSRKPFDKAA